MPGGHRSGIAGRGRAGSAGRARPRWTTGGRKRTKRQSLSASGRAIASPSKIAVGSAGSSPGNTAASAAPSNTSPSIVSPRSGVPMIALRMSAVLADLGLAGGADRGQRDDVDLRADAFGAGDRLGGQEARRIASSRSWLVWCRWSALVAANRMRSIRGRKIEAKLEARPARKADEHLGQRILQVRAAPQGPNSARSARRPARSGGRAGRNDRGRTASPRRSCKPRSAAPSSPPSCPGRSPSPSPIGTGAKVRAGEPSRSPGIRKRPGRQGRERVDVLARLAQVGGELLGHVAGADPRSPPRAGRGRRARRASRPRAASGQRVSLAARVSRAQFA